MKNIKLIISSLLLTLIFSFPLFATSISVTRLGDSSALVISEDQYYYTSTKELYVDACQGLASIGINTQHINFKDLYLLASDSATGAVQYKFLANAKFFYKNGQKITLDSPLVFDTKKSIVYMPLFSVAKSLGYNPTWETPNKAITYDAPVTHLVTDEPSSSEVSEVAEVANIQPLTEATAYISGHSYRFEKIKSSSSSFGFNGFKIIDCTTNTPVKTVDVHSYINLELLYDATTQSIVFETTSSVPKYPGHLAKLGFIDKNLNVHILADEEKDGGHSYIGESNISHTNNYLENGILVYYDFKKGFTAYNLATNKGISYGKLNDCLTQPKYAPNKNLYYVASYGFVELTPERKTHVITPNTSAHYVGSTNNTVYYTTYVNTKTSELYAYDRNTHKTQKLSSITTNGNPVFADNKVFFTYNDHLYSAQGTKITKYKPSYAHELQELQVLNGTAYIAGESCVGGKNRLVFHTLNLSTQELKCHLDQVTGADLLMNMYAEIGNVRIDGNTVRFDYFTPTMHKVGAITNGNLTTSDYATATYFVAH